VQAALKIIATVPVLGWIGLLSCLILVVREVRPWTGAPWRLSIVPLCAALASLTTFGPSGLVRWHLFGTWGAALVVGMIIGIVAAHRAGLRVDHQWNVLRLRVGWTGLVVALFTIGGLFGCAWQLRAGEGMPWNYALVAIGGTGLGFFVGRAVALMRRARATPHSDIVSAYSVGIS
jgi:hypothetical protein